MFKALTRAGMKLADAISTPGNAKKKEMANTGVHRCTSVSAEASGRSIAAPPAAKQSSPGAKTTLVDAEKVIAVPLGANRSTPVSDSCKPRGRDEAVRVEVSHVADPDEDAMPATLGAHKTPREHAIALVNYCRDRGYISGSILARDMQWMHRQMCLELGWLGRSWNSVANELRLIGGGKKLYMWEKGAGGRRRLRIYSLEYTTQPKSPAKKRTL